ncbi:endonuclease/exonuclease/phosphatase family protein [Aureimonas pseudogalii]|uniref:Endonuclease/exonuclease/phosphatase (EEP) superfamily protein YafD n=1 Tax=Aureimonas pseudogalii TaxID=1744844 RepID=A0A7W6H3X2_9HYPH|nr:endonuclease/exonuclease/phosphatase family protein [Aureimonas pseudogalii]MBB3998506.1 endonuclease/exonuclease/phosphatase (EEP) superfamily protein YafD [Aureimonas pseudogalii]
MRLRDELSGALTLAGAALATIAALSVVEPFAVRFPVAAQLAPIVAAPLLLVALALVILRRRARPAVLVVLAAAALWSAFDRWQAVSQGPADLQSRADAVFTLVSFNAFHANERAADAVPYLLASGADAVLLLEAEGFATSLPVLSTVYPYRIGCDGRSKCDMLLLSKHPPKAAWTASLGAVPASRYVQFGIDFDGHPLTLVGVHLTKPWFDDLAAIELSVLAERVSRLREPVLLAGDFNTLPWSPQLADWARRTGFVFSGSYVGTWPAALGALRLPIDHVLARGATILSVEAMPGSFGSNHRGLVTRFAVPRGGRPSLG